MNIAHLLKVISGLVQSEEPKGLTHGWGWQGNNQHCGHCCAGGSGRLGALEGKSFTSECANV